MQLAKLLKTRKPLLLTLFAGLWLSLPVLADSVPVPAGTPAAQTQAAAPVAGAPAPQQQGLLGMFLPFALVFGVMYFFMIRPQQKKLQDHKTLLESIKKGDDVVTTSGFLGTVTGITDKVVTLELADNVRVKMLKSQISQVVKGNQIDAVS